MGMILSKLLNKVFIVMPKEEAYAMAEELIKAQDPMTNLIGVIAHTGPYKFEIVKEAQGMKIEKTPKLSIKVMH